MKLFDHIIKKGGEVTRTKGLLFSIFLIQNKTSEFFVTGHMFHHGWGNGYVGLPLWHPYYKMEYEFLPIDCHGGLTFGELDEDEDLWVIGFDTAHWGDNKTEWSKERVQKECEYIEEQCVNVKECQRIMKLKKINKL